MGGRVKGWKCLWLIYVNCGNGGTRSPSVLREYSRSSHCQLHILNKWSNRSPIEEDGEVQYKVDLNGVEIRQTENGK